MAADVDSYYQRAKAEAREEPAAQRTALPPEELAKQVERDRFELITFTACMAGAVLAFGGLVLLMEFWFLGRAGALCEEASQKLLALTIIGTLAVFLIVAGYGQTQIAAVIGLFGTALGYLMGRSDRQKKQPPEPADPPPAKVS